MAWDNAANKYDRWTQGNARTFTNPQSTTSNQWYGSTLVFSRDTLVSAPMVSATSRIFLSTEWLGGAESYTTGFMVSSKVAGTGFCISATTSVGFGALTSYAVHWELTTPT